MRQHIARCTLRPSLEVQALKVSPERSFGDGGSPKSNLLKYSRYDEKGHKVLADPRVHRHSVRLNSEENEKFITMFEQSGMKNKAEFIFARIFG